MIVQNKLTIKTEYAIRVGVILTFVAYLLWLLPHYSIDSYNLLYDCIQCDAMEGDRLKIAYDQALFFLRDGRYTRALVMMLFALFRKSAFLCHSFWNIVAVLFLSLSVYKVIKILADGKNEIHLTVLLGILVCFINPFICDWLQFQEANFLYQFGIYITVCAADVLCNKKEKKYLRFFISSFLLALAAGIYQMLLQYFVLFCMIFMVRGAVRERDKLDRIQLAFNGITAPLFVYALVCAIQLFVTCVLFTSVRVVNGGLVDNIISLIKGHKEFLTFKLYFGTDFGVILPITIIVALITETTAVIKSEYKKTTKVYVIACLILGILGTYASVIVPPLMTDTVWLSPRTLIGFYGIPLLTISVVGEDKIFEKHYNITTAFLLLLLIFNISEVYELAVDIQKSNYANEILTYQVQSQIEQYEKEEGIQVSKIGVGFDENTTWANPNVFTSFETNLRAFIYPQNINSILYLFCGETYERVEMDKNIYDEYFAGQDWNTYHDEQIVFVDDTVYICVY